MLKKIISTVTAFCAAFGLMSCASNKVNLCDYSSAAVISASSNSLVPWYDAEAEAKGEDNTSSLLNATVNKTLGVNDPEVTTAQSRIDYAVSALSHVLEDNGISVLGRETVNASESYESAVFFNVLTDYMVPDGYKRINVSKGLVRNISADIGCDLAVSANFTFQKEKRSKGSGYEAYSRTKMEITVWDSLGNRLLSREYVGYSISGVTYRNGSWNRGRLCDLFVESIDSVVNQFALDYCAAALQNSEESGDFDGTSLGSPSGSSEPTSLKLPSSFSRTEPESGAAEE